MISNSEVKLFYQSALAMLGFLVFLSVMGWIYQPKSALHPAPVAVVEVHK